MRERSEFTDFVASFPLESWTALPRWQQEAVFKTSFKTTSNKLLDLILM